MPRSAVLERTNCSMARIRTSDSAASWGGATLVAVPPWQNSARPRTSPRGAWVSSRAPATVGTVTQWSSVLVSCSASGGAAAPAEGGAGPVAEITDPQQRPADLRRSVAPLQRAADPAQQAGGQGKEDGEDQPRAQPAGEKEPHDRFLPRRPRGQSSAASRTTILPVFPPRRRFRNAG